MSRYSFIQLLLVLQAEAATLEKSMRKLVPDVEPTIG